MHSGPCDPQAGGLGGQEPSASRWLAAYTKPHFEHKMAQYCRNRGIDVYLPTYKSWRRWSDRRVLLDFPLFPSYIFVGAGSSHEHRAQTAPGFLWYVRNSTGPVEVDGGELDSIRRMLESGLACDPMPGAQLGDEVEVVKGPLRGCRGFLERKDESALVLRVSAIQGMVRVAIVDPSFVRRCGFSRGRPSSQMARVALGAK